MKEISELPEAEKILEIPISYEEKGKEIGKEIGKKIGKKIGKEIGKELGKKEVAIEMLKKGLSMELISEVTQLDIQEIEELKKLI